MTATERAMARAGASRPPGADVRWRRRQRRELTERLMVEYAGALPPGQVVAAVMRASRLVGAIDLDDSRDWVSVCEAMARRWITERVARGI